MPTTPHKRQRVSCASYKRRLELKLMSGRWSKREPLCEDCVMHLERERVFPIEEGNKSYE
jgi:hypothetical protein